MSTTASAWPRLTEEYPASNPMLCAICSDHADDCWREHDEKDKPENKFIVLCRACSKRVIDPHPRLYSQENWNAPRPGAMPTCEGCGHRKQLTCMHPALKANGGPGLLLKVHGVNGFIDGTKNGKRWGSRFVHYTGPTYCAGRTIET